MRFKSTTWAVVEFEIAVVENPVDHQSVNVRMKGDTGSIEAADTLDLHSGFGTAVDEIKVLGAMLRCLERRVVCGGQRFRQPARKRGRMDAEFLGHGFK